MLKFVFNAIICNIKFGEQQMTAKETSFIKYINDKIAPYHLTLSAENKAILLLKKYSLELLIECVDISLATYISYGDDGKPQQNSINKAIDKIGGIAYNKSLTPVEKEIAHICNTGAKAYAYWDDKKAKALLHQYVKHLSKHWSEFDIIQDLKTEVMDLFATKSSSSQWTNQVSDWIDDIIGWDKPSNKPIPEETILPNALFINAPRFLITIQQEINASYQYGLYDCTAIMMRRLMEILLIQAYRKKGIEPEIKNGDYYINLDSIIKNANTNATLDLTTNTKKDLKIIKDFGNLSAHRILFNCTQSDIDAIKLKFRTVIEELLYKAQLI